MGKVESRRVIGFSCDGQPIFVLSGSPDDGSLCSKDLRKLNDTGSDQNALTRFDFVATLDDDTFAAFRTCPCRSDGRSQGSYRKAH
jgi:hypothetical protein